jgi:hypothetical protein
MGKYIPTMAIDCVLLEKNTSIFTDEQLVQLLSNIRFNSDNVDEFDMIPGCNIQCEDKPCVIKFIIDKKAEGIDKLTSADLKLAEPETNIYNVNPISYTVVESVSPDAIPITRIVPLDICQMFYGHYIRASIFVKKGTHSAHSRFRSSLRVSFESNTEKNDTSSVYTFRGVLAGNMTINNILKHTNAYMQNMQPIIY